MVALGVPRIVLLPTALKSAMETTAALGAPEPPALLGALGIPAAKAAPEQGVL